MGKCKIVLSLMLQSSALMWCQTQPIKESASSSGDFYAGGAYTSSNPASSASAGIGPAVDFRAYKWVEIQGDISVFFATSGVGNLTTTVDSFGGTADLKLRSKLKTESIRGFLGGRSIVSQ